MEVRAVGHIKSVSWGRASTPEIVDKPGRPRLGRQLNGKAAMKDEIKAAIRMQRALRGALCRARIRSEELEGVRHLHGGLEHMPLPSVVALSRAARTDPEERTWQHVETIHEKLQAFERVYGKIFPGVPEGVYRALLMHVRFASGVEGEVLRQGHNTLALDDTLSVHEHRFTRNLILRDVFPFC